MHMSRLLDIYLQDHHAGATAGVELARRTAGTNGGGPFAGELKTIAGEIEQDLASLERIMADLGVRQDRRKDVSAWIGEKLGRLKRNGTWLSYSPLSRVVELEGLVIGVTGKQALWEALADSTGERFAADLEQLAKRARDQRRRLDELRRRAAQTAFADI
jgi:hypothetical protein